MERFAFKILNEWKAKQTRKPMIIQGARQVGKTWLMKEFGRINYKNIAYIWFEKNSRMQDLFAVDMDVHRILRGIELEVGNKIDPKNTLIVFDEVQECPNALTSLKYFNENAPEYDILVAGSLLGMILHRGFSFPVGKVEFMNLYPMNFIEFLLALGEKQLCTLLDSCDWKLIKVFKEKFVSCLKMYFYVGGMPEVVLEFSKNRSFDLARKIQEDILNSYQRDFSKHIHPSQLQKVIQLWTSIPIQLAKENKKFVYKEVQKGGRASAFEVPFGWLESCGLIHKVSRLSKVAQPLRGYENTGAFKLFLCDIGLLSAMSALSAKTLLEEDALFTEFKGALTEQYVCQEMKIFNNTEIAYWTNNNAMAEVDFVLQLENQIIPIEAKASTNLKAKSLSIYREKFHPKIEIRTSLADYKKTDNLFDIPLYTLYNLKKIIEEGV